MKKFYSFMVIMFVLFSSTIFFACGDSYKKLSMEIYNSQGENISELSLILDNSNQNQNRRLGIEINGVKEDLIGKISVYSIPNEILIAQDYTYDGNMVYVDYVVSMATGGDSKLVVSHLDSGKKKEIPLIIKQKSNDLTVKDLKYIVEIPEDESLYKEIDFSQVVNLIPANSDDKIYFKTNNVCSGVEYVKLEGVEGYEDVYKGFNVSPSVEDGESITIYPVTQMDGYQREKVGGNKDPYEDCKIKIYFYKTLKDNDVKLFNDNVGDLNNIRLVANGGRYSSLKFNLKLKDDSNFYESELSGLYNINFVSGDEVVGTLDGEGNVVVTANTFTHDYVKLSVLLVPNGYVGEISTLEIQLKIKGEVKADEIQTYKNGVKVENLQEVTIFDYYEEGTSYGSAFQFTPTSYLGEVAKDLSQMQIILDPTILNADCSSTDALLNKVYKKADFSEFSDSNEYPTAGGDPKVVKSQSYALSIYKYTEPIKFYYDATLNGGMMVSEPFDKDSRIYIKHVQGKGSGELINFGISVKTIRKASVPDLVPYWKNIEGKEISINFNPLKGVKSMEINAGYYYLDSNYSSAKDLVGGYGFTIYLDRSKGLDNDSADVYVNFLAAQEVKDVEGATISETQMEVYIESLQYSQYPLLLSENLPEKDNVNSKVAGKHNIVYNYEHSVANPQRIGLVFRSYTSLGKYVVRFKQDGIEKKSINIVVYEEFDSFDKNMISLETNEMAFVNDEWAAEYEADYIVASGQALDVNINLPQAVLDSENIISGYAFEYDVDGTSEDEKYFDYKQDNNSPRSKLYFKEGTFISGAKCYVTLTITINKIQFKGKSEYFAPGRYNGGSFDNDADKPKQLDLKFFIYNEISTEKISINETQMVRYYEEYLAIDYKNLSQANLKIQMQNESLWNYVSLKDSKKVVWYQDEEVLSGGTEEISFVFRGRAGFSSYVSTVKAYVYQFNNIFELQCVFDVRKPILTTSVLIESELNVQKETQQCYINLKEEESYTILAKNVSIYGEVTHPEISIIVTESGTAIDSHNYFEINNTDENNELPSIKVKQVPSVAKDFKLIIFARDVLKGTLTTERDYQKPSNLIMNDFPPSEKGAYLNAYFVINIILSDGSEENPYLIKNADDFYQIDDNGSYKTAHYQVRNDISLDATTNEIIENFSGHIKTYQNNIYTFDGLILDQNRINLFKSFKGNVENIKFIVEYRYEISSSSGEEFWLGLFDTNSGTLTNVSAEISGGAILSGNGIFYFGGLVGENKGIIQYKSGQETLPGGSTINWAQVVGVYGTFGDNNSFKPNENTYFGGLVGKNVNKIIGSNKIVSSGLTEIILSGSLGRIDSLSIVEIYASDDGLSSDFVGAIGGVVGLNSYITSGTIGTIENAFVTSKIVAPGINNVGGVIGKNEQEQNEITIKYHNTDGISYAHPESINNSVSAVQSASKVYGKNNVGGLVGLDENGVYFDCDFQVLTEDEKTVSIEGTKNVGGIAGNSKYGKFIFCSVMSYPWRYDLISSNTQKVVVGDADIFAEETNAGGIVGCADSDDDSISAGDNDFYFKVVIISSSVNAYIKTEETSGLIGGILSSSKGKAVVYNSYFIGKLEGKLYVSNLLIDNDGLSIYDKVYSINLKGSSLQAGEFSIDGTFTNDEIKLKHKHWGRNDKINGGFVFVTKDEIGNANSMPIFDLAPTSIDVKVKNETISGLERVLRLEYYDFSIDKNLTDLQILNFKQNKNKIINSDFKDKLNIVVEPSNLTTVVLNVQSSNPSIVDVTFDGGLIINGIGECWLTFSSVINPNAGDESTRKLKVVVDYPIGIEYKIVASGNRNVSGSTEGIAKGSTKQYQFVTAGYISFTQANGRDAKGFYKTKSNFGLDVTIKHTTCNVDDYVKVSGQSLSTATESTISLDANTPFMISIIKHLESGYFEIEVEPYWYVNNGLTGVKVESGITQGFNVTTNLGVREAAFSFDEAVVYPNDTVYFDVDVTTDSLFVISEKHEILKYLEFVCYNSKFTFTLVGKDLDVNSNITSSTSYLKYEIKQNSTVIGYFTVNIEDVVGIASDKQKIKFILEFSKMTFSEEILFGVNWELSFARNEECLFTLLPQRINKIEIKNYYIENDGKLVLKDILKPTIKGGEMILDLVPNNGYYSYLEIKDVTGNEEIVFIQVYDDGTDSFQDPTEDGLGVKLHKDGDGSRIKIKTQIDNGYSSKIHTIQIAAYSSAGHRISQYFYKYIDVRMLPDITAYYLTPNGKVSNTVRSSIEQTGLYLANGVDANFRVETKNANTDVEVSVACYKNESGSYVRDTTLENNLEIETIDGNFFTLKFKTFNTAHINKKVKITFSVATVYDGEDEFDQAICSMEFIITNFVIHGVSVNSSIDNNDSSEIYGYFGKDIQLEFYFGNEDISYFNGYDFWNTEYTMSSLAGATDDVLRQINAILNGLNSAAATGKYLILNNNTKKVPDLIEYESIDSGDIKNLELSNNMLKVSKADYNPKYLAVAFKLVYDKANIKWEMKEYTYTTASDVGSYIVDKNYKLNFIAATKWYEPTVINSVEEFKTMQSGGRYILNLDLVGANALTNYNPLDVELVEFDGNGHTIEIKSFAQFNDPSIKAGLFKHVYEKMVVKNVKVKYVSVIENSSYTFGHIVSGSVESYLDLCNNLEVNYTDAKFGGIAAVNEGVITNCHVEGEVAIRASVIEQKKFQTDESAGKYEINLFIAGMVVENWASGYITHSTAELSVYSRSNIGGFVYQNNGTIASCGVEEKTVIDSFDSTQTTIEPKVSGFAFINTNRISMSYVNLFDGTIHAAGIAAGFIRNNSGIISDSYVKIQKIGSISNVFSGFVHENNGQIFRSYTIINQGNKSYIGSLFAPQGTEGLQNCIEFINTDAHPGYVSGISSSYLTTEDYDDIDSKACYEKQNFAFGDNSSAVWRMDASNPILVSTKELLFNDFKKLEIIKIVTNVDGVETTTYDFNYMFANLGTKENPYIIHDLSTWNDYLDPTKNLYMTSYYRIVKDIDFLTVENPKTSNVTFKGNLQGNNMILKNIKLYSTQEDIVIGLFKDIVGVNDRNCKNSIRNLTLQAKSVTASSSKAAGVLAGIIENFNIYNITIDSKDVIIVGGNAVGGLAGIVRGTFDIDQISSNIGANSTRATGLRSYSIYMSKNNRKTTGYNLKDVYYAGSVVGILDGYSNSYESIGVDRTVNNKYNIVQHITVNGRIVLLGDSVGAAFGLIGEKVYVKKAKVNISGSLFGFEYSAGFAGENRGVIESVEVNLNDDIFNRSVVVSSGLVGFNLGGLIKDVSVNANINKEINMMGKILVGGIVGRNVYGIVNNVYFNGKISGNIAGGIIGVNYSKRILVNALGGEGSLSDDCISNTYLIPSQKVVYYVGGVRVVDLKDVSISVETAKFMIDNQKQYFTYRKPNDPTSYSLNDIIIKGNVAGLVAGLNYETNIVSKEDKTYKVNVGDSKIIFNSDTPVRISYEENDPSTVDDDSEFNILLMKAEETDDNVYYLFDNFNEINLGYDDYQLVHLVGAYVTVFDSWQNYSDEYILVK